jgi:hypothetical protein
MQCRTLNSFAQLRYMKLNEHRKVIFVNGHTIEIVRVK